MCVAVCIAVSVAVCVAACCSVLHLVAVCCSISQRVAQTRLSKYASVVHEELELSKEVTVSIMWVCCSMCRSMLQCIAVCCVNPCTKHVSAARQRLEQGEEMRASIG